jgi:general secretion pathway protein G
MKLLHKEREIRNKQNRHVAARAVTQSGMTLIEILVVLAIIGMIMGGLVFAYGALFGQGQEKVAKAQVSQIGSIASVYMMTNGEYPDSLDELIGKGLKKSQLKDPWGRDWFYNPSGDDGNFELCSGGPDKREGGEDDICYSHDE